MDALIRLYRHTILFKGRRVEHFICLFFENAPGPTTELARIIGEEFAAVNDSYITVDPEPVPCIFCLDPPPAPILELGEIREDLDPFYAIPVEGGGAYLFLNGNRDALEGVRIHEGAVTPIAEYQESYKRDLVRDVYVFRRGYTLEDVRARIRDRFIASLKRSLCII